MSQLTVLQVAFPFAPSGDDAVGGAEQVLSILERGLLDLGHRTIVLACEGSRARGILESTPRPSPPLDAAARARAHAATRAAIARVIDRYDVDVIHLHGVDFASYLPAAGPPVVVSLHLPPSFYPPNALAPARSDVHLVCVSRAQRAAFPAGTRILAAPIENGIPLDRFPLRRKKRGFALALGRICPEKGYHHAVEAARRAAIPLVIAGAVFPYDAHTSYFRDVLTPRLGPTSRFIGPIGLVRKRRLLGAARCLLVPSLVAETSSLVVMEALACGTPVVAFPAGALADLVREGVTGFLVQDELEMAAALSRAADLDPAACRAAAEAAFSADRMVARYVSLYRDVVRAARARA